MSPSAVTSRPALMILVLGAALAACKQPAAPAADPAGIVIKLAAEDVVVVAQGPIATGPRVSGTLEARERALVRAEVGGAVVAVGPDIGEAVARNALLARIEANSLDDALRSSQAGVASAQANYELARREVDRTAALVAGGAVAQRELDRVRSTAAAAKAGVDQAQALAAGSRSQLGDATVRSPIAGVVAQRAVNQGDVVTMGAVLYEIIVPSTMRLEASVSSADLSLVAVGKTLTFEVRGYPGQRFTGTIQRIAPAADPVTRQVPLIVEIPNPGGKLIAGLFAEGRVASEERSTLVIPQAAVDGSADRPTVLRVKDGTAERVAIATGLRDDRRELIEVTSGLVAGELVVLDRAARGIPAGTKVTAPPPRHAGPAVPTATPAAVPPAPAAPAAPALVPAKPAEQQ